MRTKRLVADIVAQLKKGGPLGNPFERQYPATASVDYVQTEVQRAIDRIRLRRDPTKWPRLAHTLPKITAADYRKLGRLLRKTGHTAYAEQIGASEHVRQEPPPRANALKHYCADEAFFVMEMFSAKAPTFSEGDPFRIIAEKLYEAVTGEKDADMERACDWILKERRKVRTHNVSQPSVT